MDAQLDVLHAAKHDAGILVAAKVFLPLALVGGWLFVLTIVLTLIGKLQEWISPALETSVALLVSSVVLPGIAYIFARRNSQRIRKALADIIIHATRQLSLLEPELHDTHEYLARFKEFEESLVKAAFKEKFEQKKAALLETLNERLKKLGALDKDATRSMRLKNPDLFLSISRLIREGEALRHGIEQENAPRLSSAFIARIRLATIESHALRKSLQRKYTVFLDHITLLRTVKAEAERLLALPEWQ